MNEPRFVLYAHHAEKSGIRRRRLPVTRWFISPPPIPEGAPWVIFRPGALPAARHIGVGPVSPRIERHAVQEEDRNRGRNPTANEFRPSRSLPLLQSEPLVVGDRHAEVEHLP